MLKEIKGRLIVSCQALPEEPLHSSFIMGRMARAAKEGGAVAIRAQSVPDILEIKQVTGLPVIGIIKKDYPDSAVFITATKKEIKGLLLSGCEMIALDATQRRRPNDEQLADLVQYIKEHNVLVMADISTEEEAVAAAALGVDCVSTTLSGYTPYSPQQAAPDFALVERLAKVLTIPVLAEGRINTPEEMRQAYQCGAHSVVVGSAITRPQLITARFVQALPEISTF